MLSRTLGARRHLVWKAWTEAEHLKRWWGPKGFIVRHCTIDLRPGSLVHYGLRSPDGSGMWGLWRFRGIAPPERLVSAVAFSDESGGIARHPFPGEWPLETLSTITFAEDGGRTTVMVEWTPETGTDADRAAFAAGFDSMRQGWPGTFDQIEAHSARA